MPTFHKYLSTFQINSDNAIQKTSTLTDAEQQLLTEWKQAVSGGEESNWEKRLEYGAHTQETCVAALRSTMTTQQDEERAHLNKLLQALGSDIRILVQNESYPTNRLLPFQDLWTDAAKTLSAWLIDSCAQFDNANISGSALVDIETYLVRRLVEVTEQATWEMFNKYRKPGEFMLASLCADASRNTTVEIYGSFINMLKEEKLAPLLSSYPVLARLLNTVVRNWWGNIRSLLERVSVDRKFLASTFGISSTAPLTAIQFSLGDSHKGGQAVAILSFETEDADEYKLVYKPKNIKLEASFNTVLSLYSQTSHEDCLRSVKVLGRKDYGYTEHIEHRPCTSLKDLKHFYFNSGRLMAFLYLLGCTDCHYENFIAHSDQLILVDPETLFEFGYSPLDIESISLPHRLADSVLRTGMLPHWIFVGPARIPVDVSCLGVESPSNDSQQGWGWSHINTDAMRPCLTAVPFEFRKCLPYKKGDENIAFEYIDEIVDGFKHQSKHILINKEKWLSQDGFLTIFRDCCRRIVLRNTRVYAALQQQQLSPYGLRSEAHQGIILEKLVRSYLRFENSSTASQLLAEEIYQMENLDIPFFTAPLNPESENDIVGSYSRSAEGIASAANRIESLEDELISFNTAIISNVLNLCKASRSKQADVVKLHISDEQTDSSASPSEELKKRLARSIGDNVLATAIKASSGQLDWLGVDVNSYGSKLQFGVLGDSLYGGKIGVALFLACLGSSYLPKSRKILEPIMQMLESKDQSLTRRYIRGHALGMSGIGGILLGLLCMRNADQELSERYNSAAKMLSCHLTDDDILRDMSFDIIGGCAGLIGPLILCGSDRGLSLAVQAGKRLAQCQGHDGAWVNRQISNYGLTGFSHGSSGIALAIFNVMKYTNDSALVDVVTKALQHERDLYNYSMRNWPDLRNSTSSFCSSWCHGAPGVLLSRLGFWGTKLHDDSLCTELRSGIETCSREGQDIDTLCCGRTGRSIILTLAAKILPGNLSTDCIKVSNILINTVLKHSSPKNPVNFKLYPRGCLQVQTPGLFNGVSGIGLCLMDQRITECIISAALLPS
jgi:type 2 lantibiotic biosynthesis protein LanM